jgi:hypothetical protein
MKNSQHNPKLENFSIDTISSAILLPKNDKKHIKIILVSKKTDQLAHF